MESPYPFGVPGAMVLGPLSDDLRGELLGFLFREYQVKQHHWIPAFIAVLQGGPDQLPR